MNSEYREPATGSGSLESLSDLLDATAIWSEALQGRHPVLRGLAALANALGAEIAALSRIRGDRSATVPAISYHRSLSGEVGPVSSVVRDVLGDYLEFSRAGTVWLTSAVTDEPSPSLTAFRKFHRIAETVVIPLGRSSNSRDFIELHFRDDATPHLQRMLNMIASLLAETWSRRVPGLFADAMLASRAARVETKVEAPLLGFSNPCRLSRAEYRVCLLLSRGLSNAAVTKELNICEPTLRTHLRNIYSKTGIPGRVELVGRLIRDGSTGRQASA